jgi:ribose 5-phosphate isomerase B
LDLGAENAETSVDYPDYAQKVSSAVVNKQADMGILLCGTGIGISIAANKIRGIRAALCHDHYTAKMAREHNDANIFGNGWTDHRQRNRSGYSHRIFTDRICRRPASASD